MKKRMKVMMFSALSALVSVAAHASPLSCDLGAQPGAETLYYFLDGPATFIGRGLTLEFKYDNCDGAALPVWAAVSASAMLTCHSRSLEAGQMQFPDYVLTLTRTSLTNGAEKRSVTLRYFKSATESLDLYVNQPCGR